MSVSQSSSTAVAPSGVAVSIAATLTSAGTGHTEVSSQQSPLQRVYPSPSTSSTSSSAPLQSSSMPLSSQGSALGVMSPVQDDQPEPSERHVRVPAAQTPTPSVPAAPV